MPFQNVTFRFMKWFHSSPHRPHLTPLCKPLIKSQIHLAAFKYKSSLLIFAKNLHFPNVPNYHLKPLIIPKNTKTKKNLWWKNPYLKYKHQNFIMNTHHGSQWQKHCFWVSDLTGPGSHSYIPAPRTPPDEEWAPQTCLQDKSLIMEVSVSVLNDHTP